MTTPMIPVFPKDKAVPAEVQAENEQERVAAAAARTREVVFKGWAASVDFKEHLLEGWLKEEEVSALAELEACEDGDAVAKRAAWRAVKRLRARLGDNLKGS